MNGRPRLLLFAGARPPETWESRVGDRVPGLDLTRWEVRLLEAGGSGPGARALALARAFRTVRQFDPAVILDCGGGSLALLLVGWLLGKPVAWGLPGLAGDDPALAPVPRWTGLRRRLSALVELALFASRDGLLGHLQRGLRARRMRVASPGAADGHLEALLAPRAARAPARLRPARYLVRFDDICPTMNWSNWDEMEQILVETGIRPILAVVPDNRDPKLMQDPPEPAFWDRVRAWQARGWTIALHGYQHTYINAEPGLLGLNRQSEFAGLGYEEQLGKLRNGLAVFAREGVRVDAWVAPSHSFDWVTVAALEAVGIRTVSDGMGLAPFRDPLGSIWVPQQFANLRPMPFGIWTFCYHLDSFTASDLAAFRKRAGQLRHRMISLADAEGLGDRPQSAADRLVGAARLGVSGLRRLLAGARA